MKKIISLFFFTNLIYSQCWKTVEANFGYHCIGIQTDGTLWTWGYNSAGQLGDGTTINKEVPTQIGTLTNWKSASNNFYNSYAIKTTGTLWAWGENDNGQLGIGNTVNKIVPTQVGIQSTWSSISAGRNYCLAIKTNGTLWAWGNNNDGRLGDGTIIQRLSPVQIGTDNDWIKIAAGSCSFGIKSNGSLWFWGDQYNGSDTNGSTIPAQVGTDTWSDISITYRHVVALKTNGSIWAWGNNDSGELGRGNNINNFSNYTAAQIGTATNWKAIGAGINTSMAIKTNGTLWAWGENTYGQYGNNTTTESFVPTQIGTAINWKSVSLGYSFTTALRTNNNRLWTWGRDNQDALGNGVNADSSIPVGIGTCTTLNNNNFDLLNNSFRIYPNPSKIELNIDNALNLEINVLKIIDVLGKVVLTQKSDFKKIDIQNLDSGIYIVYIITEQNNTYKYKLIKN